MMIVSFIHCYNSLDFEPAYLPTYLPVISVKLFKLVNSSTARYSFSADTYEWGIKHFSLTKMFNTFYILQSL